MPMKTTLGLKLSQGLSLTPALQQAIKLLQMSTLDLQTEIQEALESNLMLERDEPEAPEPEPADAAENAADPADSIPDELPLDHDWSDVYTGGDAESEQALYEFRQANLHVATDLKTHLQDQAALENFSAEETLVIEHLIDALDPRGFLPDWPGLREHLVATTTFDEAGIEALRGRLHQWDPQGVGAADLTECLLIQLDALPREPVSELAHRLISEFLEELASGTPARLARRLGCEEQDVLDALGLIRQLDPDPGAPFSSHEDQYVAPDVYVQKVEGHWQCNVNPGIAPKLRINTQYQDLIRRGDNSKDQQMLKQHLQEARYFLHSLKSRNETLLKVAQEIVDRQRGFLEYGPEAMRPLVLRDIANTLGIHESTVSRATAHKYMHTPRGLFELKYFFSSAVSTDEGGSCSATAIQAMIRRLVNEESPSKPLSDSRLAQILKDEGIQVARRTVAKYREGLNIPPSHERKRMA